jgi:ribosomal protein S17
MLKENVPVNAPLDFIKAQKLMEVEKMSKAMKISTHTWRRKPRVIARLVFQKHNNKTHVRSPNFQVGDYVLVAEQRKRCVSKLHVKWKGPRRVASMESDCVFVVENLLTKELKAAHATRLRFYKDKDLNVTAELAQAAEHNYHQLYVVSKIFDAHYNEQEVFHELLVAWRGFPVGEVT